MAVDLRVLKRSLRAQIKEERHALPFAEKARRDEEIFLRLTVLPEVRDAELILTYVSTPIEVATFRLIDWAFRRGKRVAVPRCAPGDEAKMDFYEIRSLRDLSPGTFSVPEPDPERSPLITRFSGSVCILPGLSFDRQGFRLGYGKGYYDRFLGRYDGLTVGICYADNVCEDLPHGRHDRPADLLVTESETLFLRSRHPAKKESSGNAEAFRKDGNSAGSGK